jgi:UDP:flavonoid glycosyltransferase YjiC (YdhE family)
MRSLRILFFGEAVTLAHVARPMTLAAGLGSLGHHCAIAAAPAYDRFLRHGAWDYIPIHSLASKDFLQALATGRPHHDYALLKGYIAEDLQVIQAFKPDVVIGDFRLSLGISARLAKVPYAALVNAYWSPLASQALPIPALPITGILPIWLAQGLMDRLGSLPTRGHCAPINRLRREHGLPEVGNSLRSAYSDADFYLYPDIEALFDLGPTLPDNHAFLGPVHWEPSNATPDWWDDLDESAPIVYVSLGSSGRASDLQMALDALADLPVQVMASAPALPAQTLRVPANTRVAEFLPGAKATKRSALVVTNGGSLSVNQALTAGVPVIGIASNMDQLLNMRPVEQMGLGRMLRGDRASRKQLQAVTTELLASSEIRSNTQTLALQLSQLTPPDQLLSKLLEKWLPAA